MTDPYRRELFGQDVAYVIVNSPMLTDHVQRRLASMYDISVTDSNNINAGSDNTKKRDKNSRRATHVKMFPGAIVCSLLRSNIERLVDERNNYVALEKTDGVRYLLLLTSFQNTPYAILVDRKMEMRIVNLDLPYKVYEKEVLFDGELAQNIDNGLYTFLIFDLVYTGISDARGETFSRQTGYATRMKQANDLIRENWQKTTTTDAEYKGYSSNNGNGNSIAEANNSKNTFKIKVKRYVKLADFANIFANACQHNTWTHHGFHIDGFVFVPSRQVVEPFRNQQQYKFKPTERHTIDVQLMQVGGKQNRDSLQFELLAKNSRNSPARLALVEPCALNLSFLEKHRINMQQCHDKKINFIVECSWDTTLKCWILQQPRSDKQTPNSLHTIEQTKLNIDEDIKLDELVSLFAKKYHNAEAAQEVATQLKVTEATELVAATDFDESKSATDAKKGPFVHPSRQTNFQSTTAGSHLLPLFYSANNCDAGCDCTFCTKKQHDQSPITYDPEENWQISAGDEKQAKKRKCLTATSAQQAKTFFENLDLDILLQQANDPTKLEALKKTL